MQYPDGRIVYLDEATTTPTVSGIAPSVFTVTLKRGSKHADVMRLQKLLATDKDIYPEGDATGYFGPATERAVQRFQKKYGIVSSGTPSTTGYGALGPATRAKLKAVFSGASVSSVPAAEVANPSARALSVSPVFNIGLTRGKSHPDVKRLQILLNNDPETRIAESGAGSPGSETEYFGTATEKAVQKFQIKYGLSTPEDTAFGYVGPKTRAKLKELSGN
jgi:peptidoglycan hydrolase-like protein with peptidoglycan-binding domain